MIDSNLFNFKKLSSVIMQRTSPIFLLYSFLFASASAQGLYQASNSAEEPMPLKWGVGTNVVFDDNVASSEQKESSLAFNPALTLSVTKTSPQTVWDVNGRLGLIYYPSPPKIDGTATDDLSNQSRIGANLSHSFTERLRFTSNNMASREREPEYAYGIASARQGSNAGEYISLSTDNSIGFRWTKRVGSFTGLKFGQITNPGTDGGSDRTTWEFHNQLRYQYSPQSVITTDYRYAEGIASGSNAQDSTDHYLTVGDEYRFSPRTIGIIKAGAQFHDIDKGESSTNPYLEISGNSKVNDQLSLKTFVRYSTESEGLYRQIDDDGVNFSARESLRVGVTGEYMVSPMFSIVSGVDYIPSSYVGAKPTAVSDKNESLVNAYVTASVKFNDFLSGNISYTYTDQTSDFNDPTSNYDRSRISVGLSANF
jgi:hypothetical protein